ncbi:alcohol dehydrogenase, partial [Fusarium acutatum]
MTTQQLPKTMKQWNIRGTTGSDSLKLSEVPLPGFSETQVLIQVHSVSINYRDTLITKGQYPMPVLPDLIPGSDSTGTVVAVGSRVTRFKPGDKVVTLFMHDHLDGPHVPIGGVSFVSTIHGALRTYCPVNELGVVPLPRGLSFQEGAILSCAALTAWDALYGLIEMAVKPGQWAAGARVIATTGNPGKGKLLEKLGADYILNYRETPDWGAKAKKLTGGVGVDLIIEVAGEESMWQSLACIKRHGVIIIVGLLGGIDGKGPTYLQNLLHVCTTRGVAVGTQAGMEDMNLAIEGNLEKLRPVIDERVFKFEEKFTDVTTVTTAFVSTVTEASGTIVATITATVTYYNNLR